MSESEKPGYFTHKDPLSSAIFLTAHFLSGNSQKDDPNFVMNYCESLYTRLEALEKRKLERFEKG